MKGSFGHASIKAKLSSESSAGGAAAGVRACSGEAGAGAGEAEAGDLRSFAGARGIEDLDTSAEGIVAVLSASSGRVCGLVCGGWEGKGGGGVDGISGAVAGAVWLTTFARLREGSGTDGREPRPPRRSAGLDGGDRSFVVP